jgi:hypothetical protein
MGLRRVLGVQLHELQWREFAPGTYGCESSNAPGSPVSPSQIQFAYGQLVNVLGTQKPKPIEQGNMLCPCHCFELGHTCIHMYTSTALKSDIYLSILLLQLSYPS